MHRFFPVLPVSRGLLRTKVRARALGSRRAPEGGSPSLAVLPARQLKVTQEKNNASRGVVYDRLSSQKMSQVYHWLVPNDEPEREPTAKLAIAENEKDRGRLRPSFL